jgi:hypothetical protein
LTLEPLPIPQPPLTGWETLKPETLSQVATKLPKVSHGTMYQYLSDGVGHDGETKTFRALYRGYNHWASGRVEKIEVNTQNLYYCFVRCVVAPSMKQGSYKVYLVDQMALETLKLPLASVLQGCLHHVCTYLLSFMHWSHLTPHLNLTHPQ